MFVTKRCFFLENLLVTQRISRTMASFWMHFEGREASVGIRYHNAFTSPIAGSVLKIVRDPSFKSRGLFALQSSPLLFSPEKTNVTDYTHIADLPETDPLASRTRGLENRRMPI